MRFWMVVSAIMISINVVGMLILSFEQLAPSSVPRQLTKYFVLCGWAGVLWLIVERSRVRRGQIGLASLFSLVSIQAVACWLAWFVLER